MGGLARFNDRPVMVIGHEKGNDTQSRIERNFGMARPEGYRKAIRLMELADRFGLPVVTLVDTSGAFPGVQAEERGQAEAIAKLVEGLRAENPDLIYLCDPVIGDEGGLYVGDETAIAIRDRRHDRATVWPPTKTKYAN